MDILFENKLYSNLRIFEYNSVLYTLEGLNGNLFLLDQDNQKYIYVSNISNCKEVKNCIFDVKVHKNKIYGVPYNSNQISIYNFQTNQLITHDIKLCVNKIDKKKGHFINACFYKENMILLPFAYREIIWIDFKTNEQYCIDLSNRFPKEKYPVLFCKYMEIDDAHIALPLLSSNEIVILDLSERSYTVIKCGGDGDILNSICCEEDDVYVMYKNKIGIYKTNKSFEYYDDFLKPSTILPIYEKYNTYFEQSGFEFYNGYLYCFPAKGKYVVKIAVDTGEVEIIHDFDKYCIRDEKNINTSIFNGAIRDGKYLYLSNQLNGLLRYNLDTGEIKELSFSPYTLRNFMKLI